MVVYPSPSPTSSMESQNASPQISSFSRLETRVLRAGSSEPVQCFTSESALVLEGILLNFSASFVNSSCSLRKTMQTLDLVLGHRPLISLSRGPGPTSSGSQKTSRKSWNGCKSKPKGSMWGFDCSARVLSRGGNNELGFFYQSHPYF